MPESLASYGAVVITGASSGIGEEFVKVIASLNQKARFINISRTAPAVSPAGDRMRHCGADLSSAAGQDAAVVAVEKWLSEEGGVGEILLINNSGFGSCGPFPDPGVERTLAMIDLNVRAPVALTARLLPRLRERGGAVINIASIVAFQPTPLMSVYGATKAFVLNWSLGLWSELRGTKVRVLCVCPGATVTKFFKSAGVGKAPKGVQTSGQVVEESLAALAAGKPFVVCGWSNKLQVMVSIRLPRVWATLYARKIAEKLSH